MPILGDPKLKNFAQIHSVHCMQWFKSHACLLSYIDRFYCIAKFLSGQSKLDKTKILMTNGSFMKVESSILQYFWPALWALIGFEIYFFGLLFSGRVRQVLHVQLTNRWAHSEDWS